MAAKKMHKCLEGWASSSSNLITVFHHTKKMLNLHQKGAELGPGEDISPSK